MFPGYLDPGSRICATETAVLSLLVTLMRVSRDTFTQYPEVPPWLYHCCSVLDFLSTRVFLILFYSSVITLLRDSTNPLAVLSSVITLLRDSTNPLAVHLSLCWSLLSVML